MSEKTTRRFRIALADEISQWRAEGLIANDLAEVLTARYPIAAQTSRVITISLIVGAILVGLGIILFVGSNWVHMARIAKVAGIVAAIVLSHIGAWYCKYEPGNRPKLGSALLLLGSLLYGAGIWLISQIFNFDTDLSQGLMLWLVGTGAMSVLTQSQPNAILTALLILGWNFSSQSAFTLESPTNFHGKLIWLLLSTAAGLWISAKCRSQAAAYSLLLGAAYWVLGMSGTSWVGGIVFGAFLFSMYFVLQQKSAPVAGAFLYVGECTALLSALLATFDRTASATQTQSINLAILIVLVAVPQLLLLRRKSNQSESLACLSVAACAPVLATVPFDLARVGLANTLTVAMLIAVVYAGIRLQKVALINTAIGFLVIDIICRYFDVFYSMLDRSLFFVLGGIVLICAGAAAERNRRRLTGSFS